MRNKGLFIHFKALSGRANVHPRGPDNHSTRGLGMGKERRNKFTQAGNIFSNDNQPPGPKESGG